MPPAGQAIAPGNLLEGDPTVKNSDLKALVQSVVAALLGAPVSPVPVAGFRSALVVTSTTTPANGFTSCANTFQIIPAPVVGAIIKPVEPLSSGDFALLDAWLRRRIAAHLDWADDVAVQAPGLLIRGSGERLEVLARRVCQQAERVLGRSFAYEIEPVVGLGWEVKHWHTGRPMVVAADETLCAAQDDPSGRALVALGAARR